MTSPALSSPPVTAPVSPLLTEHERLGAILTDFAGWRMPLRYGSEIDEHHAVRTSAGVFDLSHMGEIVVHGDEAAAALDHSLIGKASAIAVGRAKYSVLCDESGGVLDDLVVYRLADDDYLVVANASNTPVVVRELTERATGFEAEVIDRSAQTGLVAVQGPVSEAVVIGLAECRSAVADLKYYAAQRARVAGIDVLLARTGYTGEDGFELYVDAGDAVPLWRALLAGAAEHGGVPAGLACRDTLRLEAGMALYGHELTADRTPFEAGLGRLVRFDTDFVGRDRLAEIAEQPPTRTLVGLTGRGRRAARAGYAVLGADGTSVGVVTSGVLSPTLRHPIALAYVDATVAAPGTAVTVDVRGRAEPFTVADTPFYRRVRTTEKNGLSR